MTAFSLLSIFANPGTIFKWSGNSENVLVRRHHEFLPSDVFVASYPRSGNTWMRLLLTDLMLQRAGLTTNTRLPIHQDSMIPNVDDGQSLNGGDCESTTTRLLKTHAEYHRLINRAIVIVRRPADCLCSYYHFHLRYDELHELATGSVDEFCCGKIKFWKRHVGGYLRAAKRRPSTIFLTSYEQLYEFPVRVLQSLGEFIGMQFSRSMCQSAIDNHSFAKHRQIAQPKGKFNEFFYRRGEIDSARAELSERSYRVIDSNALPLYQQANKLLTVRPR